MAQVETDAKKGIEQKIVTAVDTGKDRFFCEDAAVEDGSVVKAGLFEVGRVGESDICKSRPLRESGLLKRGFPGKAGAGKIRGGELGLPKKRPGQKARPGKGDGSAPARGFERGHTSKAGIAEIDLAGKENVLKIGPALAAQARESGVAEVGSGAGKCGGEVTLAEVGRGGEASISKVGFLPYLAFSQGKGLQELRFS